MTNHETNNPESNDATESMDTHESLASSGFMVQEPMITPNMHQELALELVDPEFEQKTAGFWMRFWAFLIDSMVVTAIVGIAVNPIFYLMDWKLTETVWYAPISIISAIIYYVYFVVMTYYFNQTIGKMIFGLRVTTLNGEKLTLSTVIFREWVGRLISNAILPLYFLVIFLDKNQGLHDYFADTKVIQENVYIKQNNIESSTVTKPIQEEPASIIN